MKKFKFALGTVLSYKQQILDSLQAEHASAIAELRQQEQWLMKLQQDYGSFAAEYRQRCESGLEVREAITYQIKLRAREDDLKKENVKLKKLQKAEEEKRMQVVEAKKDTSSLEKLQEKQLKEYNAAAAKYEERFIEEFVSSKRIQSQEESQG